MPEKKAKVNADKNLIQKLFSVTPLDWARYPDGRLTYISPSGQKFSYTDEQLKDLQNEAPLRKTKPAPKTVKTAASSPAAKTAAAAAAKPASKAKSK